MYGTVVLNHNLYCGDDLTCKAVCHVAAEGKNLRVCNWPEVTADSLGRSLEIRLATISTHMSDNHLDHLPTPARHS